MRHRDIIVQHEGETLEQALERTLKEDEEYERNEWFGDVYEDLGNYQLKKIISYNNDAMTWEEIK